MSKVSVIIPTYNEEDSIGRCLKSLASQTYKDFEVIVVDDGSTDTTALKLRGASKTYGIKIKVLNQEHKGPGAARNLGVKRARGEILVFIDADMTFEKDFIQKLAEPILKGKTIGTFSKEEFLANKDNVWARCWNINRNLPPDRMHPPGYSERQPVFRAILAKEFKKAGGFDEKAGYTDDWSIAQKLGVQALAAPGAKFYHRNPETLADVFEHSRWMAKRKYKLGPAGFLVALIRVSLPASVVIGLIKSIVFMIPAFFVFKIVSDFGQFLGILEYWLLGKVVK